MNSCMGNKIKKVGIIGQGYVGGNLSKWFKRYQILDKDIKLVEHSLENDNSKEIGECELVFVAVPTPTVEGGVFDATVLEEVLKLVSDDAVVVIKSTVPIYVLEVLDEMFKFDLFMSPEFLTEATAWEDTESPDRLILGVKDRTDDRLVRLAKLVMKYMPRAENEWVCNWVDASMTKYIGNSFFYAKNLFFNMMGDMIRDNRGDWELVREMVAADSRIDPVHTNNSHKGGRGAGGHCLIKDFAVMRGMYASNDFIGSEVLSSMEKRNVKYLLDTEKDVKLVEGVYSDKEFLAGISELYAQKKEKNDDGREQA